MGDHSKEKGISIPMQGKLPPIETVEELKVDRIYPVDLPWARQGIGKYLKQRYPEDLPAGAVRKQWLRFTDHREPDLLSLTIQKPKNGWLALITQSRTVVNGRFETDCDIYDEEGNLVAMSRQMGLIVSFERNAKYSDTEAPNPKL
ncbi:hypothetical protein BC829DRAFT_412448 [Chytridium lagenaria]|nr:hypothetical protein BC829DRAFT_412448 [Chytridium lagenaria]